MGYHLVRCNFITKETYCRLKNGLMWFRSPQTLPEKKKMDPCLPCPLFSLFKVKSLLPIRTKATCSNHTLLSFWTFVNKKRDGRYRTRKSSRRAKTDLSLMTTGNSTAIRLETNTFQILLGWHKRQSLFDSKIRSSQIFIQIQQFNQCLSGTRNRGKRIRGSRTTPLKMPASWHGGTTAIRLLALQIVQPLLMETLGISSLIVWYCVQVWTGLL